MAPTRVTNFSLQMILLILIATDYAQKVLLFPYLLGGGAGGADSVRVVAGGGERKVVVRGGGGKGAGRGAGRGAGSERGRGRGKGKGGAGGRGRGKKEELTAEWARTLEHARSARSRPTRTRPQGRTTPHQPPACHSPANRLPARPGLHTHSPPSSPPSYPAMDADLYPKPKPKP